MFLLSTEKKHPEEMGWRNYEKRKRYGGGVAEKGRQEPSGIEVFGWSKPRSKKKKQTKKYQKTWHTCLGIQDQIKLAGLKLGLHLGFFLSLTPSNVNWGNSSGNLRAEVYR